MNKLDMIELRCNKCNKKIAQAKGGQVAWVCPRCHTYNVVNLDNLLQAVLYIKQ